MTKKQELYVTNIRKWIKSKYGMYSNQYSKCLKTDNIDYLLSLYWKGE